MVALRMDTSNVSQIRVLACLALLLNGVELSDAARAKQYVNTFAEGDALQIHVFFAPTRHFANFNDSTALLWHDANLTYSTSDNTLTKEIRVPLTPALLANKTAYAHIFITKVGSSPDPKRDAYDRWATTSSTFELVGYAERLQPRGLYNLLTGAPAPWEDELRRGLAEAAAAGQPGQYISYWKPKLHAQLLIDHEAYAMGELPPLLHHYLHHSRLLSGHKWRPLVYINELTTMKLHWVAINSSASSSGGLPLELSYSPLPSRRFQWMVNLQHSFKMNEETLGISEKESEDLRGMFVHTSPVLLYTTVAVSAVHLLFDVLAFKNDVSFWSSVDSMDGLSSRTLVLNQVMEAIVLAYLFEEDASWLVKISSAFSLLLGFFKIFKSVAVRSKAKAAADGKESQTDEIDRLAFKYLSPPVLLLIVGYSAYSLRTGYYRGWYAWLIESLVALVYGGGFIVMTPQLFINYRLKSVAHLNWKFFMYKALNTFIDDLFAFIIKMPTLHRMSCFRDDIVFAVFMYQRYIYRVDMTRRNEFGHTGDGSDAKGEATDVAPKAASTTTEAKKSKRTKKVKDA